MKTRLVLWGTDAEDARVLVILALNAKENKVDIWTFPEDVATETFYNRLINEWRMGHEIPFPTTFIQIERPLSISDAILPEDIKVERTDLVHRAQTEWHFVVLSAKLHDAYQDEIKDFKEKIENLGGFDNVVWEELKGFWEKVQNQIHEKNLFRDHARKLKESTNSLFAQLKELRKSFDDEFRTASKATAAEFTEMLDNIEERIENDRGLKPLFEELKKLQNAYRDAKMTREDRNKVWARIDKAFKKIKEKRFGPGQRKEGSALERIRRRYDGLLAAIEKMERSIGRDKRDVDFQDKKIEQSEGQLEAQIRQAKQKMVEERIKSKELKLQDMIKTRSELEARMASEEAKEKSRQEQAAKKAEVDKAKEDIKEKIADDIRDAAKAREDMGEDLKKAAEAIEESKTGKKDKAADEGLSAAIKSTLGESLVDIKDTVKAVAEVVGEKIEEAIKADEEE